MKVAVGLSGGVDSAVAAYLLKNQGHDVIGVCMKIWDGPGGGQKVEQHACYGPGEDDDIKDAQAVANALNIPFHLIDCAWEYKRIVLSHFSQTYLMGKTPNPCVICNAAVKFGLLPQLLQQSGVSFEKFATGHYVRRVEKPDGTVELNRAKDLKKDQSYFLYRLQRSQLTGLLFPLGDLHKSEVRVIAAQNKIPVSNKQESQDFYEGDYGDLIKPDSANHQGDIVDHNGKILGQHTGIWNYTIGKRKGLGISFPEPRYVIGIDAQKNRVIVGPREMLLKNSLTAHSINMLCDQLPDKVQVKIRSGSPPISAAAALQPDNTLSIDFHCMAEAITPGQSAVLYDGDRVLGGGIIV